MSCGPTLCLSNTLYAVSPEVNYWSDCCLSLAQHKCRSNCCLANRYLYMSINVVGMRPNDAYIYCIRIHTKRGVNINRIWLTGFAGCGTDRWPLKDTHLLVSHMVEGICRYIIIMQHIHKLAYTQSMLRNICWIVVFYFRLQPWILLLDIWHGAYCP